MLLNLWYRDDDDYFEPYGHAVVHGRLHSLPKSLRPLPVFALHLSLLAPRPELHHLLRIPQLKDTLLRPQPIFREAGAPKASLELVDVSAHVEAGSLVSVGAQGEHEAVRDPAPDGEPRQAYVKESGRFRTSHLCTCRRREGLFLLPGALGQHRARDAG